MSAFCSLLTTQMGLAPPHERELGGVRAEPAARAPDEHVVALLHAGAVLRHQLAVRGGVDETGSRRLLPAQVVGLGHQLVGLDEGDLGETAEVGLEAPDALLGVEHRVVVAVRGLQLDGETVRDDLVAGLPGVDAGAGAQDHAREVGADDVVRQVVAPGEVGELAVALQEAEGRHRLEDRGPHGVVVDRGGHDGHQGLARPELRHRHVVQVDRLAGVLVAGAEPGEHLRLVLVHGDGTVGLGERKSGEVGGRGVRRLDRVQDFLHGVASGDTRPRGDAEGYVGAAAEVRGVPSVRRRWCCGSALSAREVPVTQASGRAHQWCAGTAYVRGISARLPPGQHQRMAHRATWQGTECHELRSGEIFT